MKFQERCHLLNCSLKSNSVDAWLKDTSHAPISQEERKSEINACFKFYFTRVNLILGNETENYFRFKEKQGKERTNLQ